MCGICGYYGHTDEAELDLMLQSIRHRGPDDFGKMVFKKHRVGLGHTRLSIIDTSEAGRQPFVSPDQKTALVFNGEIYNYAHHRQRLSDDGYCFRSRTDTEVLLALYLKNGISMVREIEGMYAIALWDENTNKITLIRDPLGVKPLYYFFDGKVLLFGSEIKAILRSSHYPQSINWQSVHDFFTFLHVPEPSTMFKGIEQVPAGSYVELELSEKKLTILKFADLSPDPEAESDSYSVACEKVRHLVTESVKSQLVSDVPLGIFLSGGVDSQVIAGTAARIASKAPKTFTVKFSGNEFSGLDESADARRIASTLGCEHHEIEVPKPDPTGYLDLISYFDQPFGNPTYYLMHLMCRYAAMQIKVSLSGAGGDELFAGYPRYRIMDRWSRWAEGLSWLGSMGRMASSVLPIPPTSPLKRRIRKFFSGIRRDESERITQWTYFMAEEDKRRLIDLKALSQRLGVQPLASHRIIRQHLDELSAHSSGMNRILQLDLRTYLKDNILTYTDRMSMSVGHESRVPFLNLPLVRYVSGLPFSYKSKGGTHKRILRDAFADRIQPTISTKIKRGFNAPLRSWILSGLNRLKDDVLQPATIQRQGVFSSKEVRKMIETFEKGGSENSHELFALIVFTHWYRSYTK